ncbi:AAA family ATPase [Streptacidiphilus sp. PB12-B1b]|uniref:HelD family protein n=1 Tax=Streptacidiphilus sp. PB12-B1b TaxID=2705012 RepID=UPI0015FBC19B|nr:ATP-binding domain-containing protein [Streptacidiphilus sp. PB12-B1b]QMU78316.1 AAA family ATPase [Streptacidiphilus sp. PB12-B1b]
MSYEVALAEQQQRVDRLFRRVDVESTQLAGQLASAEGQSLEAESFVRRLAALRAAEQDGLCFGSLDFGEGDLLHVGRVGLSDEQDERILVDWRAPVAEAFYQATAVRPMGVRVRRTMRLNGRRVGHVNDTLLGTEAEDPGDSVLAGDAALLAALREPRTGRMSPVVATIQAEQDRIIRTRTRGVLVIQGGPGTGKTVVALHRLAYLLYAERERLAARDVLVVGPNQDFVRYIDQVLPSLGEHGVRAGELADLLPGIRPSRQEGDDSVRLKGSLHMAELLASTVRARQRTPDEEVVVDTGRGTTGQCRVTLAQEALAFSREEARASGLPHNLARAVLVDSLLPGLVEQVVDAFGRELIPPELERGVLRSIREDLLTDPELQSAISRFWPVLTPEELVYGLLEELDPALRRAAEEGWTESDVPLLDEANALLNGESGLLGEVRPYGISEAESQRYHAWTATFGHIVVDEAQEFSPLAWRMLARHCPSLSMTVVGDLVQRNSASGIGDWAETFEAVARGRWHQEQLTVNYRTPAEIMACTRQVLAAIDPAAVAPVSVRAGAVAPRATRVSAEGLSAAVLEALLARPSGDGHGTTVVIAPSSMVTDLRTRLMHALPVEHARTTRVSPVSDTKGLEFDRVVLVEPQGIVDQRAQGLSDLYVALTRATRELVVVHARELPFALAEGLAQVSIDAAVVAQ